MPMCVFVKDMGYYIKRSSCFSLCMAVRLNLRGCIKSELCGYTASTVSGLLARSGCICFRMCASQVLPSFKCTKCTQR